MDLVVAALAAACLGWALYAQFIALNRNRAAAAAFLATPNIEFGEFARYSSDTVVSITGALHRSGAASGDWIAYIESSKERDTRASAPSEYRWVIKRKERPAELELVTPSGTLQLVASVEEYPLKAATSSVSGDTRKIGLQDGQEVTVFGRIRSYDKDGSPRTFSFHEIWGQDWQQIRRPYLAVEGKRTTPGVIVLIVAGLGLAGACVWRRRGSAASRG